MRETASPWVRRFHPVSQASVRLACFPHAGGSATFYFPVSQKLSPAMDVLSIQYPGRQDRRSERCIEDIGELADRITAELLHWTDVPLALFGHSMGATVAFEVARRLEQTGIRPLVLFASGRRAPSCDRKEFIHLHDDRLVAEVKELNGTGAGMLDDEEFLRMVLPALRSDYRAVETYQYRPGPQLTCPILALVGDSDPKVTIEEARAWNQHTGAQFQLKVFSGGHFFLDQHSATVTNVVAKRITEEVTESGREKTTT